MPCAHNCARWCRSCPQAAPASLCEHRGREAGGPVTLCHRERPTQPNEHCPHAFSPRCRYLPCYSKAPLPPPLLPLLREEAEPPRVSPRFTSRHTMEKQGPVAKRKMKGQLERQISGIPTSFSFSSLQNQKPT